MLHIYYSQLVASASSFRFLFHLWYTVHHSLDLPMLSASQAIQIVYFSFASIAMTVSDGDIAQLTAMGFPLDQAREALDVSGGDVEAAVNYIFGGGSAGSSSSSNGPTFAMVDAIEPPPRATAVVSVMTNDGMIRCQRSQYGVDNGRSACTCIALTAATKFLVSHNVTTEFLEEMITQGVSRYHQMSASSPVEHMSAEEILQREGSSEFFPLSSIGIWQGVLSDDLHHPMGLRELMDVIRTEQPDDQWMAIVVTKTPETVLLCFPPKAEPNSAFWLIDSHPRPQFGVDSAYAKVHASLDMLCMSLQAIFPMTDLGPAIPEIMATMYNSFDLYPLLLTRR